MRQEEVELEESSVERIYCDECGTETTDDYRIEPREVCPDCSGDTWFTSVKAMTSRFGEDYDNDRLGIAGALIVVGLLPMLMWLLLIGMDDIDNFDVEDYKFILSVVIGATLWTTLVISVFVFL